MTIIAVDDIGATSSATPPLECVRMLLSLAMTLPEGHRASACTEDDDYVLMFLDISRAHPHCEINREVWTQLP